MNKYMYIIIWLAIFPTLNAMELPELEQLESMEAVETQPEQKPRQVPSLIALALQKVAHVIQDNWQDQEPITTGVFTLDQNIANYILTNDHIPETLKHYKIKDKQKFQGCQFNSDKTKVATIIHKPSTKGSVVKIWDVNTGKILHTFSINCIPNRVFFKGEKIITKDKSIIQVWDTTTGTLKHSFDSKNKNVETVLCNTDGTQLVNAGGKTITIWDTITGTLIKQLYDKKSGRISSLSFSPDHKKIIASTKKNNFNVWDNITTNPTHKTFEGLNPRFNADSTLITCKDIATTLKLINLADGTSKSINYAEHQNNNIHFKSLFINRVCFFNNDIVIGLCRSESPSVGFIKWNTTKNTIELVLLPNSNTIFGNHGSTNFYKGKEIAGSSGPSTFIWDTTTGMLVDRFDDPTTLAQETQVTFNADGTQLLIFNAKEKNIAVWERGDMLRPLQTSDTILEQTIVLQKICRHVAENKECTPLSSCPEHTIKLTSKEVEIFNTLPHKLKCKFEQYISQPAISADPMLNNNNAH